MNDGKWRRAGEVLILGHLSHSFTHTHALGFAQPGINPNLERRGWRQCPPAEEAAERLAVDGLLHRGFRPAGRAREEGANLQPGSIHSPPPPLSPSQAQVVSGRLRSRGRQRRRRQQERGHPGHLLLDDERAGHGGAPLASSLPLPGLALGGPELPERRQVSERVEQQDGPRARREPTR